MSVSQLIQDERFQGLHPQPVFRQLAKAIARLSVLSIPQDSEPGTRIVASGIVVDQSDRPIDGAIAYVYHTSAKGWYSDKAAPHPPTGRATLGTLACSAISKRAQMAHSRSVPSARADTREQLVAPAHPLRDRSRRLRAHCHRIPLRRRPALDRARARPRRSEGFLDRGPATRLEQPADLSLSGHTQKSLNDCASLRPDAGARIAKYPGDHDRRPSNRRQRFRPRQSPMAWRLRLRPSCPASTSKRLSCGYGCPRYCRNASACATPISAPTARTPFLLHRQVFVDPVLAE